MVQHFCKVFLSIAMDWWGVINIVLFFQYIIGSLKWWLHWRNMFISNPKKFCWYINHDLNSFSLPKYFIYYRNIYSIHWPSSVVGLVLVPFSMTLGWKFDKILKTNFDLKCAAQQWQQSINRLKVMFFNFMSYIINVCQWSVLQWSLFSLMTVSRCFAILPSWSVK